MLWSMAVRPNARSDPTTFTLASLRLGLKLSFFGWICLSFPSKREHGRRSEPNGELWVLRPVLLRHKLDDPTEADDCWQFKCVRLGKHAIMCLGGEEKWA